MTFPAGELAAVIRMDGMSQFERDNTRAEQLFQRTGAAGTRAGEGISRALGQAAVLTTALGVSGGAYLTQLFRTGAAYNTLQQTSRAALRTLLGGAEAANDQMAKLDDFARNSPFSKAVFIQAQQQLLGFGVEAKKIIPIMGAVQDAVAATGGGSNEVGSIVGIFAKIQAQGRITGEELLQLGGRGIDAAGLIGQAFGKTGAEMKEEISKGTISAEQALDALTAGMVKTYGGAAAEVKKTWDGAKDRIMAANREIGAALAEPFISQQGGGYAVIWGNQVADVLRAVLSQTTPVVNVLENRLLPTFAGMTRFLDQARVVIRSWDSSSFEQFLNRAEQYAPAIAALAGALLGFTGRALSGIPIIGSFLGALGPVPGALLGIAAASPEVRGALGEVLAAFAPLAPVVAELARLFASSLNLVLPTVVDLLLMLAGVAEPAVEILSRIPPPVLAAIGAFVALQQVLGPLGGVVERSIEIFGLLSNAVSVVWAEQMAIGASKVGTAFEIARNGVVGFGQGLKAALFANPAVPIILGVAAAAAVLTFALTAQAEAAARTNERIASYRDTLLTTNGAITAATRELVAKNIAEAEAAEKAERLGLSQDTLVRAILGEVAAREEVERAIALVDEKRRAEAEGAEYSNQQIVEMLAIAGDVETLYREQAGALDEAREAQRLMTDQARDAAAAMTEVERSNERMNTALAIARDVSRDATERLRALKQALDELNGGTKSAAEAEKDLNDQSRSLEEALNAVDENGKKIGPTLVDQAGKIDTTTAAGSRLFDVVQGVNDQMLAAIQRADEAAKAQGRHGIGMDEARAAAEPYITRLQDVAREAGLSEEQVAGLVQTMLETPEIVAYALTDNGTVDANRLRLLDLALQIQATPDGEFEVSSDDFPGLMQALRDLGIDITSLPDGTVRVRKDDGSFITVEQALNNLARARTVRISTTGPTNVNPFIREGSQHGNLYSGGARQVFGQGGFPSGIYSGRPGGIHKFAEPWLPWEAYISPAADAREKNIRIHARVGELLGVSVPTPERRFATGGLEGATVMIPPPSPAQQFREFLADPALMRKTEVTFVNPVVRDLIADAWEAAQLLGGLDDDV